MKRKPVLLVAIGSAVLAIIAVSTLISHRRSSGSGESNRARGVDARQSPVAEKLNLFLPPRTVRAAVSVQNPVEDQKKEDKQKERKAERTDSSRDWSVIAATLNSVDAAQRRARGLKETWRECACSIFPRGESQHYFVVVGTNLTRDAADTLRDRATAAGLPGDTYVTKLLGSVADDDR